MILGLAAALSGLIAFLFYKSGRGFLLLLIPCYFYCRGYIRSELKKRRDRALSLEFRDCIVSLSGYLSAGYSVENAFLEVYRERAALKEHGSIMERELLILIKGISLNKNIEDMLKDMALRSESEDIRSFAFVFALAKRNGGDLREIISRTAGIIRDRISVEEDIRTTVRGIRYEQMIMTAIPFFIVFYINLNSGGFLTPLYDGIPGRIVMSIALLLIFAAFILSARICDIRI